MNSRLQFRLKTLLLWMIPIGVLLVIGLPLIDLGRLWRRNRVVELREELRLAERERIGEELVESYYGLSSNVEHRIAAGEYAEATRLVKAADPKTELERAINRGDRRFMAVAEDAIILPGLPLLAAEEHEYWLFPGTSDVIEDIDWQRAATEYAAAYNPMLAARLSKP